MDFFGVECMYIEVEVIKFVYDICNCFFVDLDYMSKLDYFLLMDMVKVFVGLIDLNCVMVLVIDISEVVYKDMIYIIVVDKDCMLVFLIYLIFYSFGFGIVFDKFGILF